MRILSRSRLTRPLLLNAAEDAQQPLAPDVEAPLDQCPGFLDHSAELPTLPEQEVYAPRLSDAELGTPTVVSRQSSFLTKRRLQPVDSKNQLLQPIEGVPELAFSVIIRTDSRTAQSIPARDDEALPARQASYVDVEVVQDAVSEAVADAMTGVVQEAVQGVLVTDAVQGAVQDAVAGAVQQAIDDNLVSFDVKANIYTLVAVTGVVLYWRGVWTLWDKVMGFAWYSEVAAISVGLAVMVGFRLANVPLLSGLPGG